MTVELLGIPKEEAKVEAVDGALVIEGERKLVKEKKEEAASGAKADMIKAELINGILEVVIPVPEVKPNLRNIPIRTVK